MVAHPKSIPASNTGMLSCVYAEDVHTQCMSRRMGKQIIVGHQVALCQSMSGDGFGYRLAHGNEAYVVPTVALARLCWSRAMAALRVP